MEDTLRHLIALSHVPKVGPILGRTLVSYCGSPEAVFRTPVKQLARIPQIGQVIARHIHQTDVLKKADSEVKLLEREGIRALGYLDPRYPARLRNFEESPLVLYTRGDADLDHPRTVGVVGTRLPTPQGRMMTEELVEALAPLDVMIISGMAHGIDQTAHLAALTQKVPTLGILGHGFHTLYPAANRSLAKRMTGLNGLATEYPFHTLPDREHFPMRNRIIAAWCDAVVIVESKDRGGSLITAEFANRYNKDVFAFPGRVQDPNARGCHLLIKRHKAYLIENASDLAENMRWESRADQGKGIQSTLFPTLEPEEDRVVQELSHRPEQGIDELGFRLGLTPGTISTLLLQLEFKGLVRTLPGKRYILTG